MAREYDNTVTSSQVSVRYFKGGRRGRLFESFKPSTVAACLLRATFRCTKCAHYEAQTCHYCGLFI